MLFLNNGESRNASQGSLSQSLPDARCLVLKEPYACCFLRPSALGGSSVSPPIPLRSPLSLGEPWLSSQVYPSPRPLISPCKILPRGRHFKTSHSSLSFETESPGNLVLNLAIFRFCRAGLRTLASSVCLSVTKL